jgi:alkyl sulfatase BDS1-like metallo-beta-lactamase superfamily hydrolase
MASCIMAASVFGSACKPATKAPVEQSRPTGTVEMLDEICRKVAGEPRIEVIDERIFVALGYDLANIVLVRTDEGNVIIDTGMSPARSLPAKEALLAKAPGDIVAVIFTHSHIDHVGGASVFANESTPIWATDSLTEHFLKQYGEFAKAEMTRGSRQFGQRLSLTQLPCSSLGRRVNIEAATKTGAMLPNKTFSGRTAFAVGGLSFELVEAHGETADQLFVYIPELNALFPGDNYYAAFPNLYSIRGTSPRPVNDWIKSLDAMRRFAPEHLVPSHTTPISGVDEVRTALTRYRDGIQWVRDRVVQGANDGLSLDELSQSIGLPAALAEDRGLVELYGQIDWSARAIYTNRLGWFDGRPETLYPLKVEDRATRILAMMGGSDAVWTAAKEAVNQGEYQWALDLLALFRQADGMTPERTELTATALEQLGLTIPNTNGRAYLLQSALELREGQVEPTVVREDTPLLDATPLAYFFDVMATRLIPEEAEGVYESVQVEFTDVDERYVLTIRNGVAEVIEGEPLPGTPEPVAIARTDSHTWRRLALGITSPAKAVATGKFKVEGSVLAFRKFTNRFRKDL